MLNEFYVLAADIIVSRAEEAHTKMCAHPDTCTNWHVRNDFIPRVRREVIAEMRAAIENLSRRD